MGYPNDFDIKSFPAGKTIAFSRSVSIWISIAFFLIVSLCGFILLGRHFKQNYPFLISIDPYTEEWSVITYPGKSKKEKLPQNQIVQEKLVRDFVTNWFTISGDQNANAERWQSCEIEECENLFKPTHSEQFNPENIHCAISCKAGTDVFSEFTENVLPEYKAYAEAAGKWTVGPMLITPKEVSGSYGVWQVVATIYPAMSASFDVLIFITINQDQNKYPATLGYYIKTFNSYRIINNE